MSEPKMLPLRRVVAAHDYRWPWMVLFVAVRLSQIAILLIALVRVIQWGLA